MSEAFVDTLPVPDKVVSVPDQTVDATVVCLLNFLAPNMIAVCQSWSTKVRHLIVLVSVAMEGNRAWQAENGGLDLRVQRTWTRTRMDHHPGGYSDVNYVHLPFDTIGQLRRAKPDVVVSSELGLRSILSYFYCAASGWFGIRRRRCQLVLAVSTSPWIEASRSGRLRRLLLRCADAVTYHGPQCRDWLVELGVPDKMLYPFYYAADPTKIYTGPIESIGSDNSPSLRIVTVGQLITRKGVREGLGKLIEVARQMPGLKIHWSLLGDGPLMAPLRETALPDNLHVDFRGNVNSSEIREAYREHEMMFFPTRGDEWGLVVDEAMHSGLVVVGNDRAQAVVTLIRDNVNGFRYHTGDPESLHSAIERYTSRSSAERLSMRIAVRESVSDRTPELAAQQINNLVAKLKLN
ncbi:glycosyltransferase family 4 protein [Aporhodopirellula aestuarii]|uniref:Glycosyltransferase family 4 protein n=1 Tax=Aporhodopirellula aestuarii TaxID=2950107 RepID=A0ABT0UBT7_9BACT|nr:glycosyltransferase family 4 protein [Aporhodopirellula aestuarii]MCM2374282.1 glycosyltransferase family 4 protein [Aporhodopirellula aestuarii]